VIVVSHDASLSPVRSTFISVVAHERFGEGPDHAQRVRCAADLQKYETWIAPIVKELP
jgi:hypothetical protein